MDHVNDVFEAFAAAFAGRLSGPGEIAEAGRLDRERLDLSVSSLRFVDEYLTVLHGSYRAGELDAEGGELAVLRGGAYVGEVIRLNSDEEWNRIDYDDYMTIDPELRRVMPERNVATCAFLVREGEMIMPLNRVERFIDEGSEQSVSGFAQVLGRLR